MFRPVRSKRELSPGTVNCPTVAPFWVSETRQGYVAGVVIAIFTAVLITYYTIISTNSLYIMKLLRSAVALKDSYVDILDHLYLFFHFKAAGKIW